MLKKIIRNPSLIVLSAVFAIVSGCTTGSPMVLEKLDSLTSVTVTYSQTPVVMSLEVPFGSDLARDYTQVGAIEVNRMGTLQYFIWLGISDNTYMVSENEQPQGYESIVLVADGEKMPLNLRGWNHESIGTSEPTYKKMYSDSIDAYYQVTLEQIEMLTKAEGLQLQTTDAAPKTFVPWYEEATAKNDLVEFVRTVKQ